MNRRNIGLAITVALGLLITAIFEAPSLWHWFVAHSTNLKDFAQIFALIPAGVFFGAKLLTGHFVVNMSVGVEAERQVSSEKRDFLNIIVKIKKGDTGTFRVHDARVKITQDGKVEYKDLDVRRFSFKRGDKVRLIDFNKYATRVPTLNFAPGEEQCLSSWIEVDSSSPCSVELVILGTMFSSLNVGQWRASTVSLPIKERKAPANDPEMDEEPIFGFKEQWKPFQTRHHEFFERYSNLQAALNAAFIRVVKDGEAHDWVVFTQGRVCAEEFFEILLMAANGYGICALKLIRSLYERAVTMDYLSQHPTDVAAFVDYHSVAQRKLMKAIQNSMKSDPFTKEKIEEVETEFLKVKSGFMVTDCSTCGTQRLNHTWHRLDLVSMAQKTKFGKLIVPAYYVPMGHVHSTMRALLSRTDESQPSGTQFHAESQPKEADMALELAHNIMLGVLGSQETHFKLEELSKPLQKCLEDFVEIWHPGKAVATDPIL